MLRARWALARFRATVGARKAGRFLAFIGFAAVGRDYPDRRRLRALREERLARVEPPGVELDREDAQDALKITITGKPVYATITRTFRFTGQLPPAAVVRRLAAEAEAEGWGGELETGSGFTRFKQVSGRSASLCVTLVHAAGPDHLHVQLRLG